MVFIYEIVLSLKEKLLFLFFQSSSYLIIPPVSISILDLLLGKLINIESPWFTFKNTTFVSLLKYGYNDNTWEFKSNVIVIQNVDPFYTKVFPVTEGDYDLGKLDFEHLLKQVYLTFT